MKRSAWRIIAIILSTLAVVAFLGIGALLFVRGKPDERARDRAAAATVMACVPTESFLPTPAEKAKQVTCPPKGARHVDGLVLRADDDGFELLTLPKRTKTFVAIRPADRPYIDVQHAQTHASLGQPVRVYLLPFDGRDVLVYMEDAPVAY